MTNEYKEEPVSLGSRHRQALIERLIGEWVVPVIK